MIISKIHQTTIQNKKYFTFKTIDSDSKNFENNTEKSKKNLDYTSMSTHNLIQNIKYLNLNVDNFVLFLNIHDSFKLFSHQIISVSIMLE